MTKTIYLWNSELKIEFITAEKGRGSERAIEIKNLSLKAIPLRYTDILLADPVSIIEDGINVQIPSPASFAQHKLLISEKRKKADKKAKDIEQALLVLDAINMKDAAKIFSRRSFSEGDLRYFLFRLSSFSKPTAC